MVAAGTNGWGLLAFGDVAAYQTLPLDGVVALPDSAILNLLQVAGETLAVDVLDLGDGTEV